MTAFCSSSVSKHCGGNGASDDPTASSVFDDDSDVDNIDNDVEVDDLDDVDSVDVDDVVNEDDDVIAHIDTDIFRQQRYFGFGGLLVFWSKLSLASAVRPRNDCRQAAHWLSGGLL